LEDNKNAKALNRIIQGRLRLRFGDLVLFIYQPSQDVIEESFDIYDSAYEQAYFSGSFIEEERLELLINHDMWTPLDDREADRISKDIEELKMQAYKNFFKKKYLIGIKKSIMALEKQEYSFRRKKSIFENITCSGLASYARSSWIIENTTKNICNELYNFENVSLSSIMNRMIQENISPSLYRGVARSSSWRSIWNSSKKRDTPFGKPSCDLSSEQIALVSYSMMYDNVYESPEAPQEELIADDICLDGWFIAQRRKHEKDKAQAQADALLSNSKIANSDEIFLMAGDQKEAGEIYGLNSAGSRQVVKQRQSQIADQEEGENLHFRDLTDVKQTRRMNSVNSSVSAVKSKGKGR
jgi:hypothetical protein